jgi:hypothetical protein
MPSLAWAVPHVMLDSGLVALDLRRQGGNLAHAVVWPRCTGTTCLNEPRLGRS